MFDETFLPIVMARPATSSADVLNVAAFEPRSYVAGPGRRSVVWVAGCHRRCPGCSQPEFLTFNTGQQVPVSELWNRISKIADIDGVCFSGGEPFEHVPPLAALARLVHESGLTVVSYSGYRLEALEANRQRFGELLDEVDLLIDGEYRFDDKGEHRWRGSGNQRVHYLTNRIKPKDDDLPAREIQITLDGSTVRFSGILSGDLVNLIRSNLQQHGFPSAPIDASFASVIPSDDNNGDNDASR